MLELVVKSFFTIYIIKLVLKHNIFINKLKVSIKITGLDIEVESKEKDAPSTND